MPRDLGPPPSPDEHPPPTTNQTWCHLRLFPTRDSHAYDKNPDTYDDNCCPHGYDDVEIQPCWETGKSVFSVTTLASCQVCITASGARSQLGAPNSNYKMMHGRKRMENSRQLINSTFGESRRNGGPLPTPEYTDDSDGNDDDCNGGNHGNNQVHVGHEVDD